MIKVRIGQRTRSDKQIKLNNKGLIDLRSDRNEEETSVLFLVSSPPVKWDFSLLEN